jgi:hypothetical protein
MEWVSYTHNGTGAYYLGDKTLFSSSGGVLTKTGYTQTALDGNWNKDDYYISVDDFPAEPLSLAIRGDVYAFYASYTDIDDNNTSVQGLDILGGGKLSITSENTVTVDNIWPVTLDLPLSFVLDNEANDPGYEGRPKLTFSGGSGDFSELNGNYYKQ